MKLMCPSGRETGSIMDYRLWPSVRQYPSVFQSVASARIPNRSGNVAQKCGMGIEKKDRFKNLNATSIGIKGELNVRGEIRRCSKRGLCFAVTGGESQNREGSTKRFSRILKQGHLRCICVPDPIVFQMQSPVLVVLRDSRAVCV